MTPSSMWIPKQATRQVAHRRARNWRRAIGCVALAVILIPASVATAVEYTAARKAGRGLAGLTCGFLEIPGNIVQETRANGAGQGFTFGLADA